MLPPMHTHQTFQLDSAKTPFVGKKIAEKAKKKASQQQTPKKYPFVQTYDFSQIKGQCHRKSLKRRD